MRSWILWSFALALVACGPRNSNPEPPPLQRPAGPLDTAQAERYVVDLVNRHRAAHGLEPVEWDETAAKAARRHAADMTRVGFTAHWGSDGSVPEQRYSEAGGAHLVQENAACFFDGTARELDPNPMFDPVQLERIENALYDEQPRTTGIARTSSNLGTTAWAWAWPNPWASSSPAWRRSSRTTTSSWRPCQPRPKEGR